MTALTRPCTLVVLSARPDLAPLVAAGRMAAFFDYRFTRGWAGSGSAWRTRAASQWS